MQSGSKVGLFGDNYMVFDNYSILAAGDLAPKIITAPQSQSVALGGGAAFFVAVDSSIPVTYQWQLNGINLPGATGATLILENLTTSQAGNYGVVVSNSAGAVTSALATLTVVGLPNLAPFKPTGWSDRIVVSTSPNTSVDANVISADQDIYLSWAVVNTANNADITSRFYTQLYLDGILNFTWFTDSLNGGFYARATNYALGKLAAGSHTLRLVTDATSVIAETDETDNDYSKTITISPSTVGAPLLVGPAWSANGTFQFSFNAIPSRRYEILSSTNLADWDVLATLVNSNGSSMLQFSDSTATNFNRRFYRSRLLPP